MSSEFTRKWNYVTNIQGGVKPITNNGSNEFLVDLSKYDGFTLRGYMTSGGGGLYNGQIYVRLRIEIKDLDGNILESLSLFDKLEYIRSPDGSASGSIRHNVDEVIPLSDFIKHKSGTGINETIKVDVIAETQAGVAGIRGSGGHYSHDISLKFALIEKKIPVEIMNDQQITFDEQQNSGDFNETPITDINITNSFPPSEKELTESYMKMGGIAAVGVGILLLYTMRSKK